MSGSPIYIGYAWRQKIQVDRTDGGETFPTGCTLRAEVRLTRRHEVLIATLTSGSGITIVDPNVIQLEIAATDTANMAPGRVELDLVRTDLNPDSHLNIALSIEVLQPVTRPA